MAYVYRHIRCDKNVPFYIGIGSGDDFSRAKTSAGRNDYWRNIVNITTWEWEILIDDISWEEACNKEKEFIAIYKRRKEGGTLANLTLGGEGQCGLIPWNFGKETSADTKKKQSLKKIGKPPPNKGKPMPKLQLEALVKINKGRTPWNKGIECKESMKLKLSEIHKGNEYWKLRKPFTAEAIEKIKKGSIGRIPYNKGVKMTEELRIKNKYSKPRKGVLQFDLTGNFIKEHYSLKDAAMSVMCAKQSIYASCKDNTKTAKGFKWKYKQEIPDKSISGQAL